MKVKIVIQTIKADEPRIRRAEVWSGELEIADEYEYLVKLSLIGEELPQPLADIPFALGIGHYVWVPDTNESERVNDGWNLS